MVAASEAVVAAYEAVEGSGARVTTSAPRLTTPPGEILNRCIRPGRHDRHGSGRCHLCLINPVRRYEVAPGVGTAPMTLGRAPDHPDAR